jgi:hypothetical protein
MKKIFLLLVVSILILSGLGAVALSNEEQIVNEPLIHWRGAQIIAPGLLGYTVIIKNIGEESVTGSYNINIITDAEFMILGQNLELNIDEITFTPNEIISFNIGPVLGFGPSSISVNGVFLEYNQVECPFAAEGTGLVIGPFVFGICRADIIHE